MLLDVNFHNKNIFLIKVGPTKCSLNWSYSNNFIYLIFFKHVRTFSGSRRSRNRSRGQLLVKNSKATTLQFESDFDFETANAQFKDEIKKETSGMLKGFYCQFRLSGCKTTKLQVCVCCELLQLRRWILERPKSARVSRTRKIWGTNTTTKPSASSITFHQTQSPGEEKLCSFRRT